MREATRIRLEQQLAELEARITTIEAQASRDPESVVEGWLGTTKSRGTAGIPSQDKDYWMVRSYEPRQTWHGKKQKYLPIDRPALRQAYKNACALGQELRKKRKQRDHLVERLRLS